MRIIDPYVMPPGEVARYLDVGVDRVRQLDPILKPIRRRNGRRFYDPKIVEKYIRARNAKRKAA